MRAHVAIPALLVAACGQPGSPPPSAASGFVIVIDHFAYSPASVVVPPGAAILVVNQDHDLHSVTSEAAPGAYRPGSVAGVAFDTGPFSATTGPMTIVIPADAADGTVVPFYCTLHPGSMLPADGSVTVSTAAKP